MLREASHGFQKQLLQFSTSPTRLTGLHGLHISIASPVITWLFGSHQVYADFHTQTLQQNWLHGRIKSSAEIGTNWRLGSLKNSVQPAFLYEEVNGPRSSQCIQLNTPWSVKGQRHGFASYLCGFCSFRGFCCELQGGKKASKTRYDNVTMWR